MNAVAAIHPAQLPVIRAALAPDESEVAWAISILDAMRQSGTAVTALAGTMIDAPVVARARRLLAARDRRQGGSEAR